MFFRGAGALYLLEDPIPAAVPADKKALDGQIVFFIWTSMAEEMRYLVDDKASGLEAWKSVLGHFQKSSLGRRLKARQDLYHVVHDPSKPISAYVHSIDMAIQVLKELKAPVTPLEHGDILLMNLHESYSTIRTTILTAKDEPDLEQIKSVLAGSSISSIPTIKQEYEDFMPAANAVRATRRKFTSSSSSSALSNVDSSGIRWCDPTNSGHCFRCGRSNHVAHLCCANMPEGIKKWVLEGRGSSSYTSHEANEVADEITEFSGNVIGPLHI